MRGLGITKGLSFVNDWEKDIDRVYQREEYAAKVRSQKEQETIYFANLLKKGHGSTPYVEGKLDAFYKDKTKQIADFAINNPNFRTDVTKMQEFQSMADELLNNPILQQDLQVKQNFERLQEAVATGKITQSHFEKEKQKYLAYANADPNTDATPYVFENPKQLSMTDVIDRHQKVLKEVEYMTYKRDGVTREYFKGYDPIALLNEAKSALADEEEGLFLQEEYKKILTDSPEMERQFPTIETWVASHIEAGNKIRKVREDINEAYLANLRNGDKTPTPGGYFGRIWLPVIQKLPEGKSAPADNYLMPATIFRGIKNSTNIGPESKALVKDNKGAWHDIDVTLNMEATNVVAIHNRGGVTYAEVSVNVDPTVIKNGRLIPNVRKLTEPAKTNSRYSSQADSVLQQNMSFAVAQKEGTNFMSSFFGGPSGTIYTGTILVPLNYDSSSLIGVDNAYRGLTEVEGATNLYTNPTVQSDIQNLRNYKLEEAKVVGKLKAGPVNGARYLKEEDGHVFVTVNGKETDDKGNKFIFDVTDNKVKQYRD